MQYTPPKRSLSTTHVGCVRKFLEKLIGGRGGRSNGRFAGSLIPSAAVFMPPVSRFPQGFPQSFLKVSSRLLQGFLKVSSRFPYPIWAFTACCPFPLWNAKAAPRGGEHVVRPRRNASSHTWYANQENSSCVEGLVRLIMWPYTTCLVWHSESILVWWLVTI